MSETNVGNQTRQNVLTPLTCPVQPKLDRGCHIAESDPHSTPRKAIPDDCWDKSLFYAARRISDDPDVPAHFPQDTMDYLEKLGWTLLRRGILLTTRGNKIITEACNLAMPDAVAAAVSRLFELRAQKENAVANAEFKLAASIRNDEDSIKAEIRRQSSVVVERSHIDEALLLSGVDPDE